MRLTKFALPALALILAAGMAAPASACRCANWDYDEHFKQSDLVFEGTALKTQTVSGDPDNWRHLVTTFKVERTLKGGARKKRKIRHYENNGANCGISFQRNTRYIVMAHKSEDGYSTNNCSYTRPLDADSPDGEE